MKRINGKTIGEVFLVFLFISFGLLWRSWRSDYPIADWHSWRQADTSSVSRFYLKNGIDLLHPRYEDVSAFASGKQNPMGYRMVEFPLYNAMHVWWYRLAPSMWTFEQSGRMLTSFLVALSSIVLWRLIRHLSGSTVAVLSVFFFNMLPFNVFYGRVVLPDQLMVLLVLIANLFLVRYKKVQVARDLVLFGFFLGIAMVIRPYAVFFAIGALGVLTEIKSLKQIFMPRYIATFLLTILPFVFWRIWISQYPEGIPGYSWLFNFNGIRFRPAWFRWLFAERLSKLILGYWGVVLLTVGLLSRPKKSEGWHYQVWFLGVLLYFSVFAGGNITHDYYQAIIMPVIAVLVAKGVVLMFSSRLFVWPFSPFFALFCVFMMTFMSWYQVKEYFNINNWPIIEAGKAADRLLPKDAVVLAPYNADTAFLYQTNRKGFPGVMWDLKTMIDMAGVTHYVSVNYDDLTNQVLQSSEYKVLEKTPKYVIVELRYNK